MVRSGGKTVLNETLLITHENQIYSVAKNGHQVKMNHTTSLTDEEILAICIDFFNQHRELALKEKLVITMNPKDEGHELTFEPLKGALGGKIQGELPVELFLRYGRNLVFSDFQALLYRLGEYKQMF